MRIATPHGKAWGRLAASLQVAGGIMLAAALLSGCRSLEEAVFDSGVAISRSLAGVSVEEVETDTHGKLSYLYRQGSDKTIVFLHGFAAQKELWLPLLRQLPKRYGVVAFDLPGHGASERKPDADYRTGNVVDTLEQALAQIGTDEFHIMGASLGAKIALRYTLRHPEQVNSLALVGPAAFHPPRPSEVEQMIAEGRNPLFIQDREDFEMLTALLFYEQPFMPWPIAAVLTRRATAAREHRKLMWEELWQHRQEIRDELAELSMPVFLLWGEADRVVDVSGVEVFKHHIDAARLNVVTLEQTGHSPMLEKTATMASEYRSFLGSGHQKAQ